MSDNPCTEGQRRVRLDFNPDNRTTVNEVKKLAADLIDYTRLHGKDQRLTVLACDAIELAAMWSVKSFTASDD